MRNPRSLGGKTAAGAFLWTLLAAPALLGQADEDCFLCHEDPELTGERGGREISLYVEPSGVEGSVHEEFACVDCHADVMDVPHEDELAQVDCLTCHDDPPELRRGVHRRTASCSDCHGTHRISPVDEGVAGCASCHGRQGRDHARSLHGQAQARGDELAPDCADCHGGHGMLPASDPASPTAVMNVPLLCGRCHREGSPVSLNREISQEHILQNYSMSIHGEGLFRQGLTVTAVCTSCHTAHRILSHTDPASSIHHENVAGTCARCHGQIEQVHRKVIEGRLWEEEPHKIPACVDCHSPHEIRRVFYPSGMANKDCLTCHADPALVMERDGETIPLFVDEVAFAAGAHRGTACAQCHTDVSASLDRPCASVSEPVDCGICHAEEVLQHETSTHGTLEAAGDADAPGCLDCHQKHAVMEKALPSSPTFARNVPQLCGSCHRKGQKAAVRIESEVTDIVGTYVDSIHGKGLLQSGLVVTATCADCHGTHQELPPSDPRSTVHRDNLSATCGECHHGILEIFQTSVHWPENTETDAELPTCEDCHTSHSIGRTDQVGFRFQMMNQCGKCHEDQAETFFETFHGKVSQLGTAGSAKCYDCHGTHAILPSSDPASTLGRENVVATCGKCHEGSHRRFAGYLTHATHHDRKTYPWLFWSFWGMTLLLVGTLTFALLHTLAWLVRLWLSRDEWKAHKALAKTNKHKVYRRFNRFNRILHLLMLLSFFALASTGMALKFSYTGWAQGFALVLGGFETTGAIHRLGALVLFGVFLVHLARVRRQKKESGRTWLQVITGPDSIIFNKRDIGEFVQSIRWFFGIGPRPRYGRYTYWEKFDYFAVFWGVLVIGSTGLLLWFPEFFTRVLPGWSVNVATIIHSDEALLAVGFIFTIHFFNTHFRPDKFPMDPVIFSGRTTVAELEYDKPGEYEELVKSGELEEHLVDPMPRSAERTFRVFGFLALGVGLLLIFLIVYAMLFGYR